MKLGLVVISGWCFSIETAASRRDSLPLSLRLGRKRALLTSS